MLNITKSNLKMVRLYSQVSFYLFIFFVVFNIAISIISGFHNFYLYFMGVVTPTLLLITVYFFRLLVEGIKTKTTNSIFKSKFRISGSKAVLTGIMSLFILLFIFALFLFVELWLVYWVFK